MVTTEFSPRREMPVDRSVRARQADAELLDGYSQTGATELEVNLHDSGSARIAVCPTALERRTKIEIKT